jgi:hypothetical protein
VFQLPGGNKRGVSASVLAAEAAVWFWIVNGRAMPSNSGVCTLRNPRLELAVRLFSPYRGVIEFPEGEVSPFASVNVGGGIMGSSEFGAGGNDVRFAVSEYRDVTVCSVIADDRFGFTVFLDKLRSELIPVWWMSLFERDIDGNFRPEGTRFHRDFFAEGTGGVSSGSAYPGAGTIDGGSGWGSWDGIEGSSSYGCCGLP